MVNQDDTIIVTSTSAPSVFIRPNGTRDGKDLKVTKKYVRVATPNPYGDGLVLRYTPRSTTSVVVLNDANPTGNIPTHTNINRAVNV
tara:strand:+ start:387 stop:647 length:261 start_codon:yes stop_codon:yes gene_type:complete